MNSAATGSTSTISVLATLLEGVHGAVAQEAAPGGGIALHRVPGRARRQLADPALDFMSAVTSGVRLRVRTDAPWIEVDLALARVAFPGRVEDGSVLDAVVDGVLREPIVTKDETLIEIDHATGLSSFRPGGPATVRVELGVAGENRPLELWLPHASTTSVLGARIPRGHELAPDPDQAPRWVHHGSSISQCSEADRPTGTWPALVAREAGRSLVNLGIGGQCQLDPFMARLIRDTPAEAISLELGINIVNLDSMRERVFTSALHGFLDTIRDGHPDTPLLVVTPIPCPSVEDAPGPTVADVDGNLCTVPRSEALTPGALTLGRIRDVLAQQVRLRIDAGDSQLRVVDGRDLLTPTEAIDLPDGLHPDALGYRTMAQRFLPLAFGQGGALAAAAR